MRQGDDRLREVFNTLEPYMFEPLAIPEFFPTRWITRWQGIVV